MEESSSGARERHIRTKPRRQSFGGRQRMGFTIQASASTCPAWDSIHWVKITSSGPSEKPQRAGVQSHLSNGDCLFLHGRFVCLRRRFPQFGNSAGFERSAESARGFVTSVATTSAPRSTAARNAEGYPRDAIERVVKPAVVARRTQGASTDWAFGFMTLRWSVAGSRISYNSRL